MTIRERTPRWRAELLSVVRMTEQGMKMMMKTMQMHRTVRRRLARKGHMGSPCACAVCGQPVYPYPLPLSPAMRLVRGYPGAHAELDRCARAVRFDARMRCVACTPPVVVQWWRRWEEMAADLLATLPPCPGPGEPTAQGASDAPDAHDEGAARTTCPNCAVLP